MLDVPNNGLKRPPLSAEGTAYRRGSMPEVIGTLPRKKKRHTVR